MDCVNRARVLCVDDNRDIADSEAELLRIVGFDARVSYDGPTALALARDFLPDVCLLDFNMPAMDGDELAMRLRRQSPGRRILFIALTAMGDSESLHRTNAAGFHLHLTKPVDPDALLRIVEELSSGLSADSCRSKS